MRITDRRRRLVAVLLAVAVLAFGFVVVSRLDSVDAASARLHDGGVWVSRGANEIGRINTEIYELDVRVRVERSDRLWQWEDAVMLFDSERSTLTRVDVATTDTTLELTLPAESLFSLGGGVGAVLDRSAQRLYAANAEVLSSLTFSKPPTATSATSTTAGPASTISAAASAPPAPNVPGATSLAVGVDGTVYALAPETGVLYTLGAGDTDPNSRRLDDPVGQATMTVVGTTPVIYDAEQQRLLRPGQPPLSTRAVGAGLVLQQPGVDASTVLVASDQGLYSIALASGDITLLVPVPDRREPSAPVRVGPCAYGAWNQPPTMAEWCGDVEPRVHPLGNDGVQAKLEFRMNRGRVVLNEQLTGRNWIPTGDEPTLVNNWDNVPEPDEESSTTTTTTPVLAERGQGSGEGEGECELPDRAANHVPTVADDAYGARPDRPRLVRPLENDDDADCDLLTIVRDPLGDPTPSGLTVDVVEGGLALQISARDPGTYTFPYSAIDGRGGKSAKQAQITVTVASAEAQNTPPEPRPDAAKLEVGKSITINVLANDRDHDGDALTLTAVTTTDPEVGNGLQFQPSGLLTMRAPAAVGKKLIAYTVTDEGGAAVTTGLVVLEVSPAGTNLLPIARSEQVRAFVGRELVVDLLVNDADGNGDALSVVQVQDPPAGAATISLENQRFVRVAPVQAGTFYLDYTVSDGTGSSKALLRVDAVAKSDTQTKPVAVRDDVVGRPGIAVVVDILANDYDADGDVLVLRSLAGASPGMLLEPIEYRAVRLTAPASFEKPVVLTYTITDGFADAVGVIIVRPYSQSQVNQPPVAVPDEARVRVGNTLSLKVLSNDSDPDGR